MTNARSSPGKMMESLQIRETGLPAKAFEMENKFHS
jgi:hypothetical protein